MRRGWREACLSFMHTPTLRRNGRFLALALFGAAPWILALAVQSSAPTPSLPDETVIKQGLVAWRTPGGKMNSACASCHAPDGFDIAQFNFTDATITRRAMNHVNPANAKKIVAMIHALRRTHHLTNLLDPMSDRPLQPGGAMLAGATTAERDLAFGKTLMGPLPTLMAGRVDSLADAKRAQDELLALDPRTLKVGLAMNRLSEDIFHGDAHGSLADWISDLPCAPKPEMKAEWFQIVDDYLASPTDSNFWKLYNAVPTHTQPFTRMPFSDTFCYRKYQSLLIAQHLMRTGKEPSARGPVEFADLGTGELPNPMWQLGEYAALNEGLDGESQGMPDDLRPTISPKLSFPVQMRQIKAPWMWLGWLQDQGLQRTPGDQNTRNGRYFTLALYTDGDFALHNCYMIARKQLVQSFDPSALPAGGKQRFVFDFSEFIMHRNPIRYEPKDAERQRLFRTMAGNTVRMSMYLLADSIQATGEVRSRATAEFQLDAIREYLAYSDPENQAKDEALVNRTMDAVMSAKDAGDR